MLERQSLLGRGQSQENSKIDSCRQNAATSSFDNPDVNLAGSTTAGRRKHRCFRPKTAGNEDFRSNNDLKNSKQITAKTPRIR
jgi:hypothetical protein